MLIMTEPSTSCHSNSEIGKIGVFDSGYGGLTILSGIRKVLPQYDYMYLGDNARAPYGTRSFDVVYDFTLQAVKHLFDRGCRLVILACNTASAKALRSIQQNDLPGIDPSRRVLGVIRPTVEIFGGISSSGHIGVLGTPGTVNSHSYALETEKLFPEIDITEFACPMWVPLIENNEARGEGADWFVKKYIDQIMQLDPRIDAIVLACTHYPILLPKILRYLPERIKRVISQGDIVGDSLADYLRRHPEMDRTLSKGDSMEYLTTENPEKFNSLASIFTGTEVRAHHTRL